MTAIKIAAFCVAMNGAFVFGVDSPVLRGAFIGLAAVAVFLL